MAIQMKELLTFRVKHVAKRSKEVYYKYYRAVLPPANFAPQIQTTIVKNGEKKRVTRQNDFVGTAKETSFRIFLYERKFMVKQTEITEEAEKKIWRQIKNLHQGANAAEQLVTTIMANVRDRRQRMGLFCVLQLQVVKKQCPQTGIEYWDWKDDYDEKDIINLQFNKVHEINDLLGHAEPIKASKDITLGVQEVTTGESQNHVCKVVSETLKDRKQQFKDELEERAEKRRIAQEERERTNLVNEVARRNGIDREQAKPSEIVVNSDFELTAEDFMIEM